MRRQNGFVLAAVLLLLLGSSSFAAEKSTATQLIELARSNSPALKDAITNTFDGKELKDGIAWIGQGADFFFAIEAASKPALFIDGASGADEEFVWLRSLVRHRSRRACRKAACFLLRP